MFADTSLIMQRISESATVKSALGADKSATNLIARVAQECAHSLSSGGDAQHISAEFTSKLMRDRKSLASIALGTNSSAMSAIANDYGYEYIFAREIESVANENDIAILITTSGNSRNILLAAEAAIKKNIKVFGLTGQSGGLLAAMCECISVPSVETARIQECHILIGHIIVELSEMSFLDL
jgi:D-sedoheptulose 7-phosphate isomerase